MKNRRYDSIKNWASDDRPREKMLIKGATALSNAELIAILIGSGTREISAVALSKEILSNVDNNLQALGKMSVDQLKKHKGIGEAKAVSIVAAMELGRRRRLEEATKTQKITGSKDAYEIMQPVIGDLNHEEFWVVYLNNSNKVLQKEQLSKGGFTGTLVDARLIFKRALELSATGILLCHNHPSGKLLPSTADKNLTQKIVDAGKIMEVKVLDHLIVTAHSYFSFADEGIL